MKKVISIKFSAKLSFEKLLFIDFNFNFCESSQGQARIQGSKLYLII